MSKDDMCWAFKRSRLDFNGARLRKDGLALGEAGLPHLKDKAVEG
jgi:hypothetical protein